jgi:hypothetical protein
MEPLNTARRICVARFATIRAVPFYMKQERKGMALRSKMNLLILKLPAGPPKLCRHPVFRILHDLYSQP